MMADAESVNRTQASHGGPEIRQACAADHDGIRDFLGGLSLQSRYLRFFTGASPTRPAMLRVLAGGSERIDIVVAVDGGAIIGHGMACDLAGPGDARATEIGVVVADARQGRGVGSALVRALLARALARGVTAVTMEVLAENRQVLGMIAAHWPAARRDKSGGGVEIRVPLAPSADRQAPPPGQRRTPRPGPRRVPQPDFRRLSRPREERPSERLAIPH
jgi:GNAT superfamily N-acetyltransferase